MRVLIFADLPDDAVAKAWMQHVRDFDTAHPGCTFRVAGNAPDLTLAQLMDAVKVDPPLPYCETVRDITHSDILKGEVHLRGGDVPMVDPYKLHNAIYGHKKGGSK